MSVPFTGVIVCFNDGRYLRQCLERLQFCQELVVVDLGSTDDSLTIAQESGARIVRHGWVNVVEKVRAFAVKQSRTDWIVFNDPDQMFPQGQENIVKQTIKATPDLGIICLRMCNYFKGKPVRYGRWGGTSISHPMIFHRDRVTLSNAVHRGITTKPGFSDVTIQGTDDQVIIHYWAHSWTELLKKQRRYLKEEGDSRYRRGERTSAVRAVRSSISILARSLFTRRGYRDGINGILLSFLAAWYQWNSELALLTTQSRINRTER